MIQRLRQFRLSSLRAFQDAVHSYSPVLSRSERRSMQHRRNNNPEYDKEFVTAHQMMATLDEWADELRNDPELNSYLDSDLESSKSKGQKKSAVVKIKWATAAMVMLTFFAFVSYEWNSNEMVSDISRYVTRTGEQKTIELSDGSVITLNTASQILVDMTANQRRVVMDRGEAYFSIAKDALRPFTVELEGRAISVLGTEFSIRRSPQGFSLALLEGVVSIHRQGEKISVDAPALKPAKGEVLKINADGQRQIFAGTTLIFNVLKQQITARHNPDISRQVLWRKGLLSFRNESLGRVVEELNRYSAKPIQLEGAGLEQLKVFATFKTDRLDRALEGLENSIPGIKVVPYVDQIVITAKEIN